MPRNGRSIPFDELHAYDPPQHFIVTANNSPVPPDIPTSSARNTLNRTALSESPDLYRDDTD